MCGIIGYSGSKPFDKEKIKLLMLHNSLERGTDATGYYSPENKLYKDKIPACEFMISNFSKLKPDLMFMGHTRSKTIGRDLAEDAHPFKRNKWILLHNGTLKNHIDLCEKYESNWSKHWVDSEVLTYCISKADNLSPISEIEGAAALLITNTDEPNVLYVFRNKERPLFKGIIDGCMYISSLEESLKLINAQNIKEFKEDTLYKIEKGLVIQKEKIHNKPYTKPIINYSNYNNDGYYLQIYKNLPMYVGSWLSCNSTVVPQNLYIGNYYRVDSIDIHTGMFRVYDKSNNCTKSVYHTYFCKDDYIEEGDIIIPIFNITYANSKEILLNEGECYTCGIVNDNDIENGVIDIYNLDGTELLCTANRKYFVKAPKVWDSFSLKGIKNLIPSFLLDENENKDKSNNEIVEDNTELNDEELAEHFDEMDEKLEELLEMVQKYEDKHVITTKIRELMDLNFVYKFTFDKNNQT